MMGNINNRLIVASKVGDINKVKELLDNGADVDVKNDDGWVPLSFAVRSGNIETVKLLIDRGANKEVKTNYGSTPLLLACYHKYYDMLILLLDVGANINVYNNDNAMCLNFNNMIWREKYTQELIINKQPQNIKIFDEKIGILPSLKEKYRDIIELIEMGLF